MATAGAFAVNRDGSSVADLLKGGGVGAGNAKFSSLEQLVAALGGKRVLRRVLIANNGIAALKGIMSMRHWAYEMLGDENAVAFVCMATPEDIKVNVEYIKMADETVEVPGGRNSNNYANVPLIIETALKTGCDAVWAGWGHASENPALPDGLRDKGIMFLGPHGKAMHELGDKIASTIVAQTAGVPTIAWSGSGLQCAEQGTGVPPELFHKACVRDAQHCVEVCRDLKFPLMIKASEGGGGKGIRMVKAEEEVVNAYHAVAGEVLNSPIFVMRLATGVRHLEVQLLADEHGDAMALRTRDCSVQRRHQKIIEEGPVVKTVPGVLPKMEAAAVRLAKLVGYRGVGTVEYLYHKETGAFYFLELNPRLQVEHTVTEEITGVNLPACMLLVGMGVPLHRIPDLRAYAELTRLGDSVIDWPSKVKAAKKHCIACRITAENPEDGFTPTSGAIEEITFRNSRTTWGYFSVRSHGGVHEFADSQFGHIFSTADTREDAVSSMVLALKQLTIRGEIRTNKEYLLTLLDMPAFKNSDISTAWLDGLIKGRLKSEAPNPFLSVLCAATYKAVERFDSNQAKYMSFLEGGHVPSNELFSTKLSISLVLDQVKYDVTCSKSSASEWTLTLGGTHIEVAYRRLADRGLMVTLEGGRSPVVYAEEDASCLRMTIDGRTATFTHETDPTKLRSQMPGKLVRYLVRDGDKVAGETPFCEIEVMKMYLQLKTSIAGTISLLGQPGTTIQAGKILARIEPDDPDSVVRAEENKKGWPAVALMWGATGAAGGGASPSPSPQSQQRPAVFPNVAKFVRRACEQSMNIIRGYDYPKDVFEATLSKLPEQIAEVASPQIALSGLGQAMTKGLVEADFQALDAATAGEARLVHVVRRLCDAYLDVEVLYEGGKLQQEVVDGLRASRQEAGHLEEVFDIELAHAGQRRHRVVVQLLKAAEGVAAQLRTTIQRLAAMSEPRAAIVVFAARHLLRQIDMPPVASRRNELRQRLTDARGSADKLRDVVDQMQFGGDVISSFMLDDADELLPLASEVFIRRTYGVADIRDFQASRSDDDRKQWFASWFVRHRPQTDNPFKYDFDADLGHTGMDVNNTSSLAEREVEGQGLFAVFDQLSELEARFHLLVMRGISCELDSVLNVFVREEKHTHGVLAAEFARIMKDNVRSLQTSKVHRVTFIILGGNRSPLYYTFRKKLGFMEDTTYRHIAPTLAHVLELPKLRNYEIELYQGNPVSHVHVYVARQKAELRRPGPQVKPRLFVRSVVMPSDVQAQEQGPGPQPLGMFDAQKVVSDCIHALEIATADRSLEQCAANHIFISFEGLAAPFDQLRHVIEKISEIHGASLLQLGAVELEFKLRCVGLAGMEDLVPIRVLCRNPTSYALEIEMYVEIEDSRAPHRSVLVHLNPDGSQAQEEVLSDDAPRSPHAPSPTRYASIREGQSPSGMANKRVGSATFDFDDGTMSWASDLTPGGSKLTQVHAGVASTSSNELGSKKMLTWHGQMPLSPYPLLTTHQARRLTATMQNTIYCYDWVVLFDKALRQKWVDTIQGRGDLPGLEAAMPQDPLVAREVLCGCEGKLVEVSRSPGENKCAMVGWRWIIRHPSHYVTETSEVSDRVVYVVANDITTQSGSFSTEEDDLFAAICRAAREEGVPLIYLSANSGARIGLDAEVKKLFKVKMCADGPAGGKLFDYLYLDDATKEALDAKKAKIVETERVTDAATGQTHHKLTAVIGSQWGLGVENLSGSGLIAGEMALSWDSIPTMSVASGRTVGIGAYLVRLGRRVVQTRNSPIILTGNNALNKLLGKEVYTSNNQLGGQNIMGPNGVSHWLVQDDYKAVQEVLKWLDYVPDRVPVKGSERAAIPPTLDRVTARCDPVDRDVVQSTTRGTPYDVRALIEGTVGADGRWVPGLFDRDTFQEAQADWAKTVCVGRAMLGGIPVGVISVETRATNKFNPADPADPTSVSQMSVQAGMVWYPDSARKTADCLADLHREGLPAIVLANWRGFSGGMRDMFDEVLKFGADIVQSLTSFEKPVLVYIPPNGELRGGAWVVIDPKINKRCIEMFVDDSSRGGVLEPEGIIEIKYREKEIHATMDRLDPECNRLSNQLKSAEGQLRNYLERQLRSRHDALFPAYKAVATEFADLHDRPGRMMAVRSIDGVVPWRNARRFLYWRLRRRLHEFDARAHLAAAGVAAADEQRALLQHWFQQRATGAPVSAHPPPAAAAAEGPGDWSDDKAVSEFFDWATTSGDLLKAFGQVRTAKSADAIERMLAADPALAESVRGRLNVGK